jgi:hypothetical protein
MLSSGSARGLSQSQPVVSLITVTQPKTCRDKGGLRLIAFGDQAEPLFRHDTFGGGWRIGAAFQPS